MREALFLPLLEDEEDTNVCATGVTLTVWVTMPLLLVVLSVVVAAWAGGDLDTMLLAPTKTVLLAPDVNRAPTDF